MPRLRKPSKRARLRAAFLSCIGRAQPKTVSRLAVEAAEKFDAPINLRRAHRVLAFLVRDGAIVRASGGYVLAAVELGLAPEGEWLT